MLIQVEASEDPTSMSSHDPSIRTFAFRLQTPHRQQEYSLHVGKSVLFAQKGVTEVNFGQFG